MKDDNDGDEGEDDEDSDEIEKLTRTMMPRGYTRLKGSCIW